MNVQKKNIIMATTLIALCTVIIILLSFYIIKRPQYTITLDLNGGTSSVNKITTQRNWLYERDMPKVTHTDGKAFAGWYLMVDNQDDDSLEGDDYVNTDKIEIIFPLKVTKNITVQAKWKYKMVIDVVEAEGLEPTTLCL
jgi:hypothetical protein